MEIKLLKRLGMFSVAFCVHLLRAKRSEAKRARKRALSHVVVDEFHLQNLKIALTQKLSILEA